MGDLGRGEQAFVDLGDNHQGWLASVVVAARIFGEALLL
jgi:hypothetical protein